MVPRKILKRSNPRASANSTCRYQIPFPVTNHEPLENRELPPPRKEKHKHQKKKSKRIFNDTIELAPTRTHSNGSRLRRNRSRTTRAANNDADDGAASDEEADDEHYGRHSYLHTPKRLASRNAREGNITDTKQHNVIGSDRVSPHLYNKGSALSASPLPRDSSRDPPPLSIPSGLFSCSLSQKVWSSPFPNASRDSLHYDINEPELDLARPPTLIHANPCDSSEDFLSDFFDDTTDGDIERDEERFLLADHLRRLHKRTRSNSCLPNNKHSDERYSEGNRDSDASDLNRVKIEVSQPHEQESVLFKVSGGNQGPGKRAPKRNDKAVTWSGAEESEMGDLDELLGLTADDAAGFIGQYAGEEEDRKTIRFEDFLAGDDGDSVDSFTERSSEEDQEPSAQSTWEVPGTEDDEHVATTQGVVEHGGFIFLNSDFDDEGTDADISLVLSTEDGGDTTDTLDDSDYLGLVRFGIEPADVDDEDAENALTSALIDRNLMDARNMGLSISIDALAKHPEAVIAKTAKTLKVNSEIAAKILTSVGLAILMNSGAGKRSEESDAILRQTSYFQAILAKEAATLRSFPESIAQESGANDLTAKPIGEHCPGSEVPEPGPIMGTFAPSSLADLCVIVSANGDPAPSPFTVRKSRSRRFGSLCTDTRSRCRAGSSTSNLSVASAPTHISTSFDEQQYSINTELYNLLESDMLHPTISDSSQEDDDMDDSVSIATSTTYQAGQTVGDVSRWKRIPIGAFRSQNPHNAYSSFAAASFNDTRDAATSSLFSCQGGFTLAQKRQVSKPITISPVLSPVTQAFDFASGAKSRKEQRKKKRSRVAKSQSRREAKKMSTSISKISPAQQANFSSHKLCDTSLPSDGLTQYVSPLFSGVTSALSIPHLNLDETPH